jgi:dolichol-phosphate mannosyltransferase
VTAEPSVVVVIPAYRAAATIAGVVARVPSTVRSIVVVDDASPDDVAAAVAKAADPRVVLLRHDQNRGVGGAMKTGYRAALDSGADVVVKIDADGQTDPRLIPDFLAPLLSGEADLAKGNRFDDFAFVSRMPFVRRVGNLALSFLVKCASGYWSVLDPCNGLIAARASLLRSLDFDRLDDRYFFEISQLCEAYFARAVVKDVPMKPVYAGETSSLNPAGALVDFAPKLLSRLKRRLVRAYFIRDFGVVSILLSSGAPSLLFGVLWSARHWYLSFKTGVVASTGTVVIGLLAIVLGFQLLLQAVVLDVGAEPRRRRS